LGGKRRGENSEESGDKFSRKTFKHT
jgi:hypothetical protein